MISVVREFEFPLSDMIEKTQKEIENLNGEIPLEDDLKYQFEELNKELGAITSRLRGVERAQKKLAEYDSLKK